MPIPIKLNGRAYSAILYLINLCLIEFDKSSPHAFTMHTEPVNA